MRQEEAAKKQEVAAEQSIVIAREKELADSALMEALPAVEAAAQVRERDRPTGRLLRTKHLADTCGFWVSGTGEPGQGGPSGDQGLQHAAAPRAGSLHAGTLLTMCQMTPCCLPAPANPLPGLCLCCVRYRSSP